VKLNRNPSIRQSYYNSEFEQFKARIIKQADSFGMTSSVPSPSNIDRFGAETQHLYMNRNARIRSSYIDNNLKALGSTVTKALDKWLTDYRVKRQSRAGIKRLLRLTDHYLEDVGFHRSDLEAALVSPIDLELIRRSPLDNLSVYKPIKIPTSDTGDVIKICCDDTWAKAA
jgi:uncharacterized protein YjiS (DUF1127 family)